MQPKFRKRGVLLLPMLSAMLFITLTLCACGSGSHRSVTSDSDSFIGNLRTRFYARQTAEAYIDEVNNGLVSFTDCADALTSSLQAINGSQKVPSDAQLAAIETAIDRLQAACEHVAAIEPPEEYVENQAVLNDAMTKYEIALEKCRALTQFYRGYDDAMRSYKTPAQGSRELEAQMAALYADFADAMWHARASFREAQAKFAP